MNHAIHPRDCRVELPDWLTRQPVVAMDYSTMTHTVAHALSITTLVLGVAELGRVTIEPMTGPIYAFAGPPISPEDWEKWWPLLSSAAVSLVGLWGMIRDKITSGFRSDIEQIKKDLSESREDSDARYASIKGQIGEIRDQIVETRALADKHDRIIEADRNKGRERSTAQPPETP